MTFQVSSDNCWFQSTSSTVNILLNNHFKAGPLKTWYLVMGLLWLLVGAEGFKKIIGLLAIHARYCARVQTPLLFQI